jgi:hypothetical protein
MTPAATTHAGGHPVGPGTPRRISRLVIGLAVMSGGAAFAAAEAAATAPTRAEASVGAHGGWLPFDRAISARGPASAANDAFCARYPQLRRTLARQLTAAKKLHAKAVTTKTRAAATKRVARIVRTQKAASARLTKACGAKVAYCLRHPDLTSTIARELAAARRVRTAAARPAARTAALKRIAEALKRQKQAAARFRTTCRKAPDAAGARAARPDDPSAEPALRLPAGASAPAGPTSPAATAPAPTLPTPTDVGLTTKLRIATGPMLGEAGNPRWLYVSESVGPWQPTYDDGHPLARGKLMNFRAINAIYDDENKDQLIPGFDPEANTDEFIRWIPTYRELGMLGFTLGLQGGKPNYEGNVASAFWPDGSLKPEWLDRAERVIRAADAHGMVVILSYFYKIQERQMEGDEAIRRATREATDWVIAKGFGNVIIEVANEYNTSGYKHPILTAGKAEATFPGVAELISLIKSRFEGKGYRLPVGASHTRLEVPASIRAVADLSLVHGNPYRPAEDGALVADLVNDPSVPGPVIVNEDFNGYGTGEANIQGERQSASNVFLAGGSWGHMWQPYNQAYPFQWAVGESEDVSQGDEANRFRAVLNHVAHLVAPDGAPPSFAELLPAPNATGVSTSASIVIGFSEPMAPASMASGSLVLSQNGVPVPASSGVASSGDLVTLTPDAPLAPNALYTVTLTPAATDTAGNPLTGGTSWSFSTGSAPAPGLGPALGHAGEVTLEAEAASARIPRGAHAWLTGHSPSGSVGGALLAGPESGTTIVKNPREDAAELRFDVRFDRPGVYRVWLRGYSPDGDANSVSLSLDGQNPDAGDASNLTTLELDGWRWFTTRNGGPVSTLSVPTAGQHTVHVYMREDGFHLDRLLLSNAAPNSASQFPVPGGTGPPASPRA